MNTRPDFSETSFIPPAGNFPNSSVSAWLRAEPPAGVWGNFRKWLAALDYQIPLGYQDEHGFHYGKMP